MKTNWDFTQSFDAVVFDCDGTLSKIEGIDVLGELNGVGDEIKAITEAAMSDGDLTIDVYEDRLNKVQPTKSQLDIVGEMYIENVTPYASTVIQDLQALGKHVYILSAGLLPSVQQLGEYLGVLPDNVCAVDIQLENGKYKDFDRESPLTDSTGKATILKKIKEYHETVALVGDGMNDLLSAHAVDCFIGFGGHFRRQNIIDKSDFYISSPTLLPILPLCVSESEVKDTHPMENDYRMAKSLIVDGTDVTKRGQ